MAGFSTGWEMGRKLQSDTDAAALRYWAANAPDMHEPSTYQQEPTTLGQQAIEDRRTESALEKAVETSGQPALPKREKSGMFGLDFKGMAGAPPSPDQPNRGLPLNQNPQTDYKPSRTADWKKWQQKMMQFSGAKSPAEVAAVNEQIGLYKYRQASGYWNQAILLHQQGDVEGAARLYQRAYDYFTNGQGVTMRGDPRTGKVLAMPFHEESGVAGKPQAFGIEDAREVLANMSPAMFGRDPAGQAQMAWAQEQRAQQMHPSAVALQEAKVGTERMRPGQIAAQTGYLGAQAAATRSTTGRQEELHGSAMRLAGATAGLKELEYASAQSAFEAISNLQATLADVYEGGPEFQRRVDETYPDGATPEQIEQLRERVVQDEISEYMATTFPGKVGEAQLQAEAALLKEQMKGGGGPELTPKYQKAVVDAVNQAMSSDKIEEGKSSSNLLDQAFWNQSPDNMAIVKDNVALVLHENYRRGKRLLTANMAIDAIRAFYTHKDNVKTVPAGDLFHDPAGELYRPGESYVIEPRSGRIVRIPPYVVEPTKLLAEQATAKAEQKLENQRQTRESRALPAVGFEPGPGNPPEPEGP